LRKKGNRMDKAYDIKVLAEKLKANGLEIAEESAKIVVKATLEWIEESAKLSATPYDDLALVVMPQVKSFIDKAIDKIDGQVG
jgi:hypothetical protein